MPVGRIRTEKRRGGSAAFAMREKMLRMNPQMFMIGA
jgi:hypothetical protein